jgi:hypothetical protein
LGWLCAAAGNGLAFAFVAVVVRPIEWGNGEHQQQQLKLMSKIINASSFIIFWA